MGRYRYYRPPELLTSPLGARYVGEMDRLFDSYADLVPRLQEFFREHIPKDDADSDFVYRQAIRAKAFDSLRGILPAGSLSNVGIYGTGQAYEALLLRMRAHPLPEARAYADLMLVELRKVIPSFLKRVDVETRGVAWSTYLADNQKAMNEVAARLFPDTGEARTDAADTPVVQLVDFDPDGELKMIAAMLYPYLDQPEAAIERRVREMSADDRMAVVRAYVGERDNRRHKPGRALERVFYRFDVLADYGAFRDLQRHRMLTIEWQRLTPRHGFTRPEAVDAAGEREEFDDAMGRSAELYEALAREHPDDASYAVSLAYKVRFMMHLNARAAMHLIELRTTPQGHPAYRHVGQEMHRLIAEEAGHHAVAEMMRFVDLSAEPELERLQAERRAEARRQQRTDPTPAPSS
jgi:thymidylate synthase ThyX